MLNRAQIQQPMIDHLGLKNPKKKNFLSPSVSHFNELFFIDFDINLPYESLFTFFQKFCNINKANDDYYMQTENMLNLFDFMVENLDLPEIAESLKTSGYMIITRLHQH